VKRKKSEKAAPKRKGVPVSKGKERSWARTGKPNGSGYRNIRNLVEYARENSWEGYPAVRWRGKSMGGLRCEKKLHRGERPHRGRRALLRWGGGVQHR